MTTTTTRNPIVQAILTILGVAILGGAIFGFRYLVTHKPEARRRNKPPTLKPMVEVAPIEKTTVTVNLAAMGSVIPSKEATLKAQVGGRITWQHDQFIDGGTLTAGTEIVKIEDTDYQLAIQQAEAALVTAETNLALERGSQDVAKREWEMLGQDMKGKGSDSELALRQPQLRSREAELKLAKLKLEQAKLNQSRTSVTTPFNAVVASLDSQVGDLASTQTVLGRLVGTDTFWVRVSVPLNQLKWVPTPENGIPGADVLVHKSDGVTRKGTIIKLLSAVETAGRMAQILVEVKDPMDLSKPPGERRRPLLLNEFVKVTIIGEELKDVVAVDRSAFRDGSQVWLISGEKTLRIRSVTPVWEDKSKVYLRETIDSDYRLITSNLGYPMDGMELRVLGEPEPEKAADSKATGKK